MKTKKTFAESDFNELLATLKTRFEANQNRHSGIQWSSVENKLRGHPEKLWSLNEMEISGGEPDVIGYENNQFLFCDCSPETPKGRRSICYDKEAREGRKQHPPKSSALEMIENFGVELLSEEKYRQLQSLGKFDLKTSSWVQTPSEVRQLGGALFCDRRYGRVFTYHNGADSYYAARGFRALLRV